MANPTFDWRPVMTMIGLAIETTPGSPQIPSLWDAFTARSDRDYPRAEPGVAYGIMRPDPSGQVLHYMAGEPVIGLVYPPAQMQVWSVSSNEYAIFTATLSTVSQVFAEIYGTWFPASGFEHADGPDLERYGAEFSPDNPRFEVLIPIRKKIN
jgi:AraC family transcriptional regulator